MHYIYILKSVGKNWYYVGSTSDLIKRLTQHNNTEVHSTKSYAPFQLLYYEAYIMIKQARMREKELKNSRSEKEKIIKRLKN